MTDSLPPYSCCRRRKGQDKPKYLSVETQPGHSEDGRASEQPDSSELACSPWAHCSRRQINAIISRPYLVPTSSFLLFIFSFSRCTLTSLIFLCLPSQIPSYPLPLSGFYLTHPSLQLLLFGHSFLSFS